MCITCATNIYKKHTKVKCIIYSVSQKQCYCHLGFGQFQSWACVWFTRLLDIHACILKNYLGESPYLILCLQVMWEVCKWNDGSHYWMFLGFYFQNRDHLCSGVWMKLEVGVDSRWGERKFVLCWLKFHKYCASLPYTMVNSGTALSEKSHYHLHKCLHTYFTTFWRVLNSIVC